MPPAVAAALYDELALDIAVRRTLAGAAVTGDPFVPELTAAAAELPEPAVIAALDDLLRRDLLRSTAVPRRFRFRHALVWRAVYQSAPGGSPAQHPGGPSGTGLASLTAASCRSHG